MHSCSLCPRFLCFSFCFCLFLPTTTITRPSPFQLLRHTLTTSWCHPATWGCHPVGFANHLHSRPPTEAFIQHGVREPQGCLRIRLIMFWPCLHLFPLDCSRPKTLGSNRLMGKQFFFLNIIFLLRGTVTCPSIHPLPRSPQSLPCSTSWGLVLLLVFDHRPGSHPNFLDLTRQRPGSPRSNPRFWLSGADKQA